MILMVIPLKSNRITQGSRFLGEPIYERKRRWTRKGHHSLSLLLSSHTW